MSKVAKAFETGAVKERTNGKVLEGHTAQTSALVISADNRYAFTGAYDEKIKIWDLQSGQCLHTFMGHKQWLKTLDVSTDGSLLVSGGLDSTIRVWDIGAKKEMRCFRDESIIQTVAISADNKRVISGSEAGIVRLWDIGTGQEIRSLGEHMTATLSAEFSLNGQFAASSSGKAITIWDANNGDRLAVYDNNKSRAKYIKFSPDSTKLLSSSEDGLVRLYDIEAGKEISTFPIFNPWLHCAVFSPDQRYVLAAYDNLVEDRVLLNVRIWTVDSPNVFRDLTFAGHTQSIMCANFSEDASLAITGGNDRTARVWPLFD